MILVLTVSAALVAGLLSAAAASANPDGTGVVINEVYGGGGNSGSHYKADFVELLNPTSAPVDLSGWTVQYRSATGTSVQQTPLTGSIAAGGDYLVQESDTGTSGDQTPLPTPDATGTIALSATGGVVILADSTTAVTTQGNLAGAAGVVDAVGWGTSTTSFEGSGPAPATTNTTSVSRTAGKDTDDNSADFTVGAPTPQNSGTASGGGPAPAPLLPIAEVQGTNTDTSPFAGQDVRVDGVVTAVYNTGGFDEFVIETGGAGGTEAQDKTPGASDAIFVFGSAAAQQVSIGESVEVSGEVEEFDGETEIDSPTVTKLATPLAAVIPDRIPWSDLQTDADKEAHEGELVAPQGPFTVSENFEANFFGSFTLAAGDEPLLAPTDAGTPGSARAVAVTDDDAARTIGLDDGSSEEFDPGESFANDPLPWLTPTNSASVGSRVTFHQPVILDFRFGAWTFQPTQQVTDDGSKVATFSNTRAENQRPAPVGSQFRIATFNVENYFPLTGEQYVADGLGTCSYFTDRQNNPIAVDTCTGTDGSPGPRGAADEASFERQQDKIVTGINRLGASIVSLEEIENSAKFGEPRDTALAGLVAALNKAAGRRVWAYVPSPPASQLPPLADQDVIRTALIYKPASVTPVGPSTVLTGDSGAGQPFSIAREPLAQGFKPAGASNADTFLVVANHLKSKNADSPPLNPGDTEDTSSPAVDQGAFNATRVLEAADLNTFAGQVARKLHTDRIFLVGDFNSYTHEDPMQELYRDGYTDVASRFDPSEHTYVFDGLSGSLDHVLANPAALKLVTGADVWQINAQESVAYSYSRFNYNVTQLFDGSDPFAASDHDPLVVGLRLPGADGVRASGR